MSGPSIGFRPDLPAIPGAAARSGRRELPAIASPAGRAGELSSLASVLGPQPSGELPALRSAVDPAADAAASWRDPAFGGALARARAERDARAAVDRSSDEYRTAREAAEQLVAEAFLKPLLALASERPLAEEDGPFAPGDVEKRFTPLLNERIADAVVRRSGWSVVDAITDRVLDAAGRSGRTPSIDVREAAPVVPADDAAGRVGARSRFAEFVA